ncbi:kinesin-like protein KIN-14J isoform X3 [Iris pallida]|uniref:Kinesin-like protein n=1 Tax=Iris pallida TaxID=29817 RepID=A0AAX6IJ41_IRIPA|nr:kinesin-like protein KIN-14J isoform X3 [Iris pallida]
MGEEFVPPSPLSHHKESASVEEHGDPLHGHRDQTQDIHLDAAPVSPLHVVHCDQDQNLAPSEAMDGKGGSFQEYKDDCLIPSPVLKGDAVDSFFGPDLLSSLQLLGTKYNNLVKKCQDQSAETETLQADYELLSSKCLQECEPRYEDLKKKYTRECSERKRLYNELIELRGNIRVFCRCRPLSSDEVSTGHTSVIEFDRTQDSELQVVCSDNSKKQFKFDHIFGPDANQEAVFAETLPVVNSVLDGYNVCIFAYGQTGTGKTFTMEGTPENRGVNYRALEELFRTSSERSSTVRYEFSVSMLEVYNEKIRDLLAENSDHPTKKLEIKQVADGTQDVPGLVEAQTCSIGEVWEMLKTGGKNRSVGSTSANELSSRSHCLVRVTVKGEYLVSGQRSRSHLWLVDLAGSERVGKIEVEGERLKESQFINKSLSALGDVISALAAKTPHIPYRNSKLTHLLQSSLGGDCKTLMFTQISPSSGDLGETLCTLNFSTRVRGIEHGPARKQADPAESFKLKQMAEKLRQEEKESARLNESLQLMHIKYASRENVFKTLQEKIKEAEQTCRHYQTKVKDLENQLADNKNSRAQALTRDSAKFLKPPLAPIKERQPLGRITNRLPPSGLRRCSTATVRTFENKENILERDKSTTTGPSKGPMKARRVSLTTIVRSIPVQPKRRASIAILPSQAETRPLQNARATNRLSQSRMPRRSVAAVNPLPTTPVAVATPDGKRRFSNFLSCSSKYNSPPNSQKMWRPNVPTFASPRQSVQLVPSPASFSCTKPTSVNKLCFSVQKRVVVGSPAAQPRYPMFPGPSISNQALFRDKEMVRRLGTAQRVLCKNRRQSVI